MTEWWLSTKRMTFWAEVDRRTVVKAAPIARRFIGGAFSDLIRWLKKQGGFRMEEL